MSDSSLILSGAGVLSPSGQSILLASPELGQQNLVAVAYQTHHGTANGKMLWNHGHLEVVIKNDKPRGIATEPDAIVLTFNKNNLSIATIGGKESKGHTSLASAGGEDEPWVTAVRNMVMRNVGSVESRDSEKLDDFLAADSTDLDACVDSMHKDGEIGPECHAKAMEILAAAREWHRQHRMGKIEAPPAETVIETSVARRIGTGRPSTDEHGRR